MDYTTRLALNKPDPDPVTGDYADIQKLNENFEKLDSSVGATICTSSTRPASPWHGQLINETDTKRLLYWDSLAWVVFHDPNAYSAWSQFVPTWQNTQTTQPNLGNGALITRYKKVGRTAHFMQKLFWGSTTTGGDNAGFWGFGGYPPELDRATSDIFFPGGAWDASAINLHDVTAQVGATTGSFFSRIYTRNTSGTLQRMGPISPFTWAAGDILQVSGAFETAS